MNFSQPMVRMTNITKSFGGPPVLNDVSVELFPGEVLILAGENGAGKSTLIRILGGAIGQYQGTIEIQGRAAEFKNPQDAMLAGISVVHQELSLVSEMSVRDNLVLGAEPARFGFCRSGSAASQAKRLLDLVGLDIDLDAPVRELSLSSRQLLEVAKALRNDGAVIVMDEPTSALNAPDVERLFAVIAKLKSAGRSIVYISHKMDEIRRLADRITVLRDGRLVGSYLADTLIDERLISLMVGEKARSEPLTPPRERDWDEGETEHVKPLSPGGRGVGVSGKPLVLRNLSVDRGRRRVVTDVSFEVNAGEVVGLAGLQGAGCSELMQALFDGDGRIIEGSVEVFGRTWTRRSPKSAVANGVAYLPNDRKGSGLVLSLSVAENTTLVALPALTPGGWRSPTREKAAAAKVIERFKIRTPSQDAATSALSGGNQQKVALGKWTLVTPKVLLLDEPTRGIDVGAKKEIYSLVQQWKDDGLAILLITSELPELLLLSDRIVAMHRGRVVRVFDRSEATAERVVQAAMNMNEAVSQ